MRGDVGQDLGSVPLPTCTLSLGLFKKCPEGLRIWSIKSHPSSASSGSPDSTPYSGPKQEMSFTFGVFISLPLSNKTAMWIFSTSCRNRCRTVIHAVIPAAVGQGRVGGQRCPCMRRLIATHLLPSCYTASEKQQQCSAGAGWGWGADCPPYPHSSCPLTP